MQNSSFRRDDVKEEYSCEKMEALEKVISHPFPLLLKDVEGIVAFSQNSVKICSTN